MTVTEPTDPATAPAFGQALFYITNHGPALPHCVCGRCLPRDDYSFPELALDACMTHVLDMVSIIESSTPNPHPSTWVSLRVLHELVAEARLWLCLQRQAMPGRA